MTPRQLLILVSEDFVKPICGQNAFGVLATRRLLLQDIDKNTVFSDGGFVEEIKPLVDTFGKENVVVIRIHRKGCTFDGDSRSYITDWQADELCINIHDFYNDEQPLETLYEDFVIYPFVGFMGLFTVDGFDSFLFGHQLKGWLEKVKIQS